MVFNRKRVRKSKMFSPRFVRPSRHPKEAIISQYTIAVLQLLLGVALLVAFYESFRIFHHKVTEISVWQKYAFPAFFFIGGLISLRSGARRIRNTRRFTAQQETKEK